jgi:hypothetical protein
MNCKFINNHKTVSIIYPIYTAFSKLRLYFRTNCCLIVQKKKRKLETKKFQCILGTPRGSLLTSWKKTIWTISSDYLRLIKSYLSKTKHNLIFHSKRIVDIFLDICRIDYHLLINKRSD